MREARSPSSLRRPENARRSRHRRVSRRFFARASATAFFHDLEFRDSLLAERGRFRSRCRNTAALQVLTCYSGRAAR